MATGPNMPTGFWRWLYEPVRITPAAVYAGRFFGGLVVHPLMDRWALAVTLTTPFTRGGLIGYTQTIGRGGLGRLTTKGNKYYEYSNK